MLNIKDFDECELHEGTTTWKVMYHKSITPTEAMTKAMNRQQSTLYNYIKRTEQGKDVVIIIDEQGQTKHGIVMYEYIHIMD